VGGFYYSGDVSLLGASDDSYLVLRRWRQPAAGLPFVQLVVDGTSSLMTASQIVIVVEGHTNHAESVARTIWAWNYNTNGWVVVDTSTAGFADTVRTVTISSNASNFIQPGTGKVSIKVGLAMDEFNGTRSLARFDQVKWTITP
jgi:hypothetical protein